MYLYRLCVPASPMMLNTQYRMHPEISIFPAQWFYDGRLIDGDNVQVRPSTRDFQDCMSQTRPIRETLKI